MQKHSKKQDAPFSRPFGATENDAQNLHALWLLPMTVVRNPAHEVFCTFPGPGLQAFPSQKIPLPPGNAGRRPSPSTGAVCIAISCQPPARSGLFTNCYRLPRKKRVE